jgi:hypothetical protein
LRHKILELPEQSVKPFRDRRVDDLMHQLAAGGNTVEIHDPRPRPRSLASLVHVAECHGYRYARIRLEGPAAERSARVTLYRDPSPGARRRAAATAAAFPPRAGGPLPGMRPGTLTPLPESAAEVALIRDHLRFDLRTRLSGESRTLTRTARVLGAVVLVTSLLAEKYAVGFATAVLLPLFMLSVEPFDRSRREALAGRLTAAGCVPFHRGDAVAGFLRPHPGERRPAAD